jgi:hypothetical protein
VITWFLVRMLRRGQRKVAQRFPADEAARRNAALEDMIRALRGERR